MNIRQLSARKAVIGLSLVACGLVGGATIAAAGTANAADPTPSSTTSTDKGGAGETALTGDTLTKVKAAVTAKYPGATFDRVTTDNDGAYEADITTAAGTRITVEVSKTFAVTGTEAHTGRGGGHHGGGAGETALTGDTLTKVKAAVTAKYPGATFDRVETDRDGAYEAHITTAAGAKVTVELDKAYAITGTE